VRSVLEKNGMQDANPSTTTGECGETPEETAKKVLSTDVDKLAQRMADSFVSALRRDV
jgi:PBP1b-binding outer membrane lipoprotein LpoB